MKHIKTTKTRLTKTKSVKLPQKRQTTSPTANKRLNNFQKKQSKPSKKDVNQFKLLQGVKRQPPLVGKIGKESKKGNLHFPQKG